MNYNQFLVYLLCMLCNYTIYPITHKNHNKTNVHCASINKELIHEKNITISKITIISTMIAIMIYLYKNKIIQSIEESPLLSCLCSCFIINFITDSISKYKQLVHLFAIFQLCKKIGRYILYIIAIKNTMQQIHKRNPTCCFKEEEYFNAITHGLPLSFAELEQLTFETLYNSLKDINNLHIKTQSTIEANLYMLSKEHITLKEIIDLYKDDEELYPYLKNFLQNPLENYDTIIKKLNIIIKKLFKQMIAQHD